MKKIFFFLSAIALLGLTACVEQMPVNPNYNAERGEVKTDFMINIATPVATKVTEATAQAQATPTFRGMDNMKLFVLKGDPASAEGAIDFLSQYYDLPKLDRGSISDQQSSKIYNLTFPTGVTNMVFYGKALKASNATDAANGKITWPTNPAKKADMVFGLSPIATQDGFDAESNKLLTALNNVVASFNITATTPLSPDVQAAYDLFTTIKGTELRLGSAAAVKRTIVDLFKTMKIIYDAAVSLHQTGVAALSESQDVMLAIKSNFSNMDPDAQGFPTMPDQFAFPTGVEENFPADLGLPEGAAQLSFDAQTRKFSYVTTHGAVDNTSATAIGSYAFPVELCYWVSSPIRTSENPDITEGMYPKTVAAWDAWSGWGDVAWTADGTITSATRAVALTKNIQYATALLKTNISYANNNKLQDNNKAFHPDEDNNLIDQNFEVRGILVGKQPTQVGWNFKDETSATRDHVVYDKVFDATAIPTTKPLYTMVFDNYIKGDNVSDNDKVVNIAIELVNKSGKDFWGKDNMIPKDGVFYLTAALDLTTLKSLPEGVESVFVQDYVTTVDLKIGETALQNAYATVPDLRSVAMTFGLSVDLKWQTGATFDITLAGPTTTPGNTPGDNTTNP